MLRIVRDGRPPVRFIKAETARVPVGCGNGRLLGRLRRALKGEDLVKVSDRAVMRVVERDDRDTSQGRSIAAREDVLAAHDTLAQ